MEEDDSDKQLLPKKPLSLTQQCKFQLGLDDTDDKGSIKKYRRIRTVIKYACEDFIPFTRAWSSHRRSTRRKAIARALQSVPEYKFHYLRSSSSLMCRLNGDKALARDLLMLLCQTQTRNDNRIANATKKQAGEAVKRGRKPKPKVEALSNGSTFLFSYVD